MATKQEVIKDKLAVYLAADKAGKGKILDQLVATVHMHRQVVIRGALTSWRFAIRAGRKAIVAGKNAMA